MMALFASPVSASTKTKAGIKPGSFFYFFDTTFEKLSLFLTFNPEKKAQKALEYADERLAEVQAIAEEKNPDAVKTAIANYESNIALATEKSKEVKDKGQVENLLTLITDNTSKNQEILTSVLAKVPDEAKEAITRAIEASRKGQEEAMKQVAELKGEVEQLKKEVAELKKKSTPAPVVSVPKPQTQNPIPVPGPTPSVSNPAVLAEENFSNVVVALYLAQLEAFQTILDISAITKNTYYSGVRQIMNDRLIQTQAYLKIYPEDTYLIRDEKVYKLLVELIDVEVQQLNGDAYEKWVLKTMEAIRSDINVYKNKRVSQGEMQGIFDILNVLQQGAKTANERFDALYAKHFSDNHNLVVQIDATHSAENAEAVQFYQTRNNETNALIAQTDRVIAASQASLRQAQDTINAMMASQPVYCTATKTMPGSVSIVCQ